MAAPAAIATTEVKREGAELEDSMGVKRARVDEENEISIPQQFVGWLKGKGGSQIKDIETKSGAQVSIDQGTKELGYSKVIVRGGAAEVQTATDIINNELKRVMDRDKYSTELVPASGGSEVEEYQIPQKYVGWLKGAGGSQIAEMESRTGASVRIDQSSRDLGYSVAQITGSREAVLACRAMIEAEVARVQERDRIIAEHAGLPGTKLIGEPNEVRIPQQYVGWIKGSGGAQIKDIEVRTAAHVTIDQSTKDLGYSRALLYGTDEAVRAARQIIESELARVMDRDKATGLVPEQQAIADQGGIGSQDALALVSNLLTAAASNNTQQLATALTSLVAAAALNANKPPARQKPVDPSDTGAWDYVQIPNSCVGWLKGRQGGMIREIENRSGCQIDIDQTTKDHGYSIAKVHGTLAQKKLAHGLVIAEVAKVLDQSGEVGDPNFPGCKSEFQIDTQYVGWVKGPKGKVVQDIQMKTGTRIDVDQNTRELGYAVVKIFGTLEGTQQARILVAAELSKISPESSSEIAREVPGGLEALQQAIRQAGGPPSAITALAAQPAQQLSFQTPGLAGYASAATAFGQQAAQQQVYSLAQQTAFAQPQDQLNLAQQTVLQQFQQPGFLDPSQQQVQFQQFTQPLLDTSASLAQPQSFIQAQPQPAIAASSQPQQQLIQSLQQLSSAIAQVTQTPGR